MLKNIKGFFKEFETFAIKGNVVDLAVGIIIGSAFTAVTNSLVTNILTPPIGRLIGGVNFNDLVIPLGGKASIQYGAFINALITFILTAFALFLIVRLINRVRALAARRSQYASTTPPAPADSPEVSILKEIRDLLKHEDTSS